MQGTFSPCSPPTSCRSWTALSFEAAPQATVPPGRGLDYHPGHPPYHPVAQRCSSPSWCSSSSWAST
eukprot:2212096-Pyramimonas_sp.AAC.1